MRKHIELNSEHHDLGPGMIFINYICRCLPSALNDEWTNRVTSMFDYLVDMP